jgi:hypothetical protein
MKCATAVDALSLIGLTDYTRRKAIFHKSLRQSFGGHTEDPPVIDVTGLRTMPMGGWGRENHSIELFGPTFLLICFCTPWLAPIV